METSLTSDPTDRFGPRLRTLRERAGLTQLEMAEAVNGTTGSTHKTAVSHWEDGRRIPGPGHLLPLVRVLVGRDVATEDLWALVASAARENHRYAGFVAMLDRLGGETQGVAAKLAAFEEWASTWPLRAA